jgi:hypothetical protein
MFGDAQKNGNHLKGTHNNKYRQNEVGKVPDIFKHKMTSSLTQDSQTGSEEKKLSANSCG